MVSDATGSLDTWMEQVRLQSANETEEQLEVYFFRQKLQRPHGDLNLSKGSSHPTLVPEVLRKICICGQIFNPDILLKTGMSNFP